MPHHNSRTVERPAGESKERQVEFRCPSCGEANTVPQPATVALTSAKTFPREHLVLQALTCEHCGCVSFFNRSLVERSRGSVLS